MKLKIFYEEQVKKEKRKYADLVVQMTQQQNGPEAVGRWQRSTTPNASPKLPPSASPPATPDLLRPASLRSASSSVEYLPHREGGSAASLSRDEAMAALHFVPQASSDSSDSEPTRTLRQDVAMRSPTSAGSRTTSPHRAASVRLCGHKVGSRMFPRSNSASVVQRGSFDSAMEALYSEGIGEERGPLIVQRVESTSSAGGVVREVQPSAGSIAVPLSPVRGSARERYTTMPLSSAQQRKQLVKAKSTHVVSEAYIGVHGGLGGRCQSLRELQKGKKQQTRVASKSVPRVHVETQMLPV